MTTGTVIGDDGLARCPWAVGSADYRAYHDDEWGRPVRGDVALYERISLEAFQSGLSWLTILRKRPGFRAAFANFDPQVIAEFGSRDIERLMTDDRIVRNRRKIEATITNAQALLGMWEAGDMLDDLMWAFESRRRQAPESMVQIPSATDDSLTLSRQLKARGFTFVGPTTIYAAMEACGIVDDHLADCHVRRVLTEVC